MILVAVMYLLFASTFTIGKYGLFFAKPVFFIGIRMLLAGLLMVAYLAVFKRSLITFRRKDSGLFALTAFIHIYVAYICEFWALNYLTAAKTCLMYNLSPFISALFSYVVFAERMTLKKWAGLGIGCAAFIPMLIATTTDTERCIGGIGFLSWAELSMLVSVTSAVVGWIIIRRLTSAEYGYSIIWVNSVSMITGGVGALVSSRIIEGSSPVSSWSSFVPWLLLIIVVANILGYNMYGYLLQRYTATFLSFAGFTTPLFAALFGWLFLHEHVHLSFFVTILLVVIGLYLFYQEELRQGYVNH